MKGNTDTDSEVSHEATRKVTGKYSFAAFSRPISNLKLKLKCLQQVTYEMEKNFDLGAHNNCKLLQTVMH